MSIDIVDVPEFGIQAREWVAFYLVVVGAMAQWLAHLLYTQVVRCIYFTDSVFDPLWCHFPYCCKGARRQLGHVGHVGRGGVFVSPKF